MRNVKRLSLTNNGLSTLLDDVDFERFKSVSWYGLKKKTGYYAVRTIEIEKGKDGKRKSFRLYLHRAIAGMPDGMEVHHKDRNSLNNQRNNLEVVGVIAHRRLASKAKNKTSKYIGVSRWARSEKWTAQLRRNGVRVFYGVFQTEVEAAVAWDAAARKLNDGAILNFPNGN